MTDRIVRPVSGAGDLLDVAALLEAREAARRGVARGDGPVVVVLLDDMHLMRQGLKALLAQDTHVTCAGDTADVQTCVTLAVTHAAHVVILNADMRNGVALTAVRTLVQFAPRSHVLALGDAEDSGRLLAMYRAGASGCLPKHATVTELREAIEMVANGNIYVGPGAARAIATGLRASATDRTRGGARSLISQLSPREQTVLQMVAKGFSGPEISDHLGITTKTVDTYRRRMHDKIGLRHRSDIVRLAMDAGILAE